jgi:hypothetical protein
VSLISLTYASTLVGDPIPSDVFDLSVRASAHNALYGVTGFLCLSDGRFLQALEGDDEVVNRIYHTRIVPDTRHEDLRVLRATRVRSRQFSAWAMGFANIRVEDRALILRFFPGGTLRPEHITSRGALDFLRALSALRSGSSPR